MGTIYNMGSGVKESRYQRPTGELIFELKIFLLFYSGFGNARS
jgi:hypothetical protein